MSKLFNQTQRETPVSAEAPSHVLLLRGGFIEQLASGIFALLPLGTRVNNKIKDILHAEMQRIGGQEVSLPVVQPAEIWQRSGRWQTIGMEMGRFKDRQQQDMVLAMTHEEACCSVAKRFLQSYRQLPFLLYHIQTKWRDELRPRAGLLRVREFEMKDSYSFDADEKGLKQHFQAHYEAYHRIFKRCGLPVLSVGSDTGMMGGGLAYEFMYPTPLGEDFILRCLNCGYAENREVAQKRQPAVPVEPLLEAKEFATPNCTTIAQLCEQYELQAERLLKMIFLHCKRLEDDKELTVAAVVRGDMDLNETALTRATNCQILRSSTPQEIAAIGAVAGYAAPCGLSKNAFLIIDTLVKESPNLSGGSNREGWHQHNINYGRDYTADKIADIALVRAGDACLECGTALQEERAIEVGHIFQLGDRYAKALDCGFLSEKGRREFPQMGSYGIGVGRLFAAIVEKHHDKDGLIWPLSVAPFAVHLVVLDNKKVKEIDTLAFNIYEQLQSAGIKVLFDDRGVQAGVKFKDADLLGMPLRLTLSRRSLADGGFELKHRRSGRIQLIVPEKLLSAIQGELELLEREVIA